MIDSYYLSYFSATNFISHLYYFTNYFNAKMSFLEFTLQMKDIVSADSAKEHLNSYILLSERRKLAWS